jgi:hypothetical protein
VRRDIIEVPDREEYPAYWQAHPVRENQELHSACGEEFDGRRGARFRIELLQLCRPLGS